MDSVIDVCLVDSSYEPRLLIMFFFAFRQLQMEQRIADMESEKTASLTQQEKLLEERLAVKVRWLI